MSSFFQLWERILTKRTEALIEDIEIDKRVALNSLDRPEYKKFAQDPHFDLKCDVDTQD